MQTLVYFLLISALFASKLVAQQSLTDSARAAEIRSKHIRSIRYYNIEPYAGHILTLEKPFLEKVEEFDTIGRKVRVTEYSLSYVSSLEPGMSKAVTSIFYNSSGLIERQTDSIHAVFQTPSVFTRFRFYTTTDYAYNSSGSLLSKNTKSKNGKVLEADLYKYDRNKNLQFEKHSKRGKKSSTIRYTYNAQGKIIKEVHDNPEQYEGYYTLHYFYNEKGQLVLTEKKNKLGGVMEHRQVLFDAQGLPAKIAYLDCNTDRETIYDYDYDYDNRKDSLGRKEKNFQYVFSLADTGWCSVEWRAFAPRIGKEFRFYVFRMDSTLFQERYFSLYNSTSGRYDSIPFEYEDTENSVGKWLQTIFDSLKITTLYERNGYLYKTTDGELGTVFRSYEYYIPVRYPDQYYLEEAYVVHWPNGSKKYVSTLNKGTGSISQYNQQGVMIRETHYVNDEKEGWDTEWYDNGQLKKKQQFHKNIQDGEYLIWDSLGTLRKQGTLLWWDQYGLHHQYDEKGRLEYVRYESKEGIQTNRKRALRDTSYTVHYFPNGKVHFKRYDDYLIWYYAGEDGSVFVKNGNGYVDSFVLERSYKKEFTGSGTFKKGVRHGLWTSYYLNGKPESKVKYKRGVKSGRGEFFYPDASRRIILNYIPEKLNRIIYYEANGKIYVEKGDGLLDSTVTMSDTILFRKTELLYPFDRMYFSGRIKNGLPDGKWVMLNEYDVYEGQFKRGYQVGLWRMKEDQQQYPKNRHAAKREDYKERKRQREMYNRRKDRAGRFPAEKMKKMGVEFY